MRTRGASSVGLMLTLDDKSHRKCRCLTWFYDEEKPGRPCRMQKASLTWEWTVGSVNINSAELLLNWPLCVQTPDGKCLFLFLSAVKTRPLFLHTASRMSGWALGPVHSDSVARLSFLLCWHFIRMETTRGQQHQVIIYFFSRTKLPNKMEKPLHSNAALSRVFQENSRKWVSPIINLVFHTEKTKSAQFGGLTRNWLPYWPQL